MDHSFTLSNIDVEAVVRSAGCVCSCLSSSDLGCVIGRVACFLRGRFCVSCWCRKALYVRFDCKPWKKSKKFDNIFVEIYFYFLIFKRLYAIIINVYII